MIQPMRQLLSGRWLVTTLLVLFGVALTIRLGIWQLDRLEQRREFNARVLAQIDQPVLAMNENGAGDLYNMEYRSVRVTGHYDAAQQVLLRNQVWENLPGYHLLTPLLIEGSEEAVLVDRGWIPLEAAGSLEQFAQPGEVTLEGVLRRPQTQPDFGGVPDATLEPGQSRLDAWNIINLERIQEQVNVPLLPVYIQRTPDETAAQSMPYAAPFTIELSEGPHLGYAIQWFIFSAILGLGYPFFIKKQLGRRTSGVEDAPALHEINDNESLNRGVGTR
jgi:surfeit locus 1 family protein